MDYNGPIERLKFPIWQDIEEPDSTLLSEAATAITDLLARAEAAETRAEKAERERDAAVRQLASLEICGYCKNGQCTTRGGTKECKWEWNGGQKEE